MAYQLKARQPKLSTLIDGANKKWVSDIVEKRGKGVRAFQGTLLGIQKGDGDFGNYISLFIQPKDFGEAIGFSGDINTLLQDFKLSGLKLPIVKVGTVFDGVPEDKKDDWVLKVNGKKYADEDFDRYEGREATRWYIQLVSYQIDNGNRGVSFKLESMPIQIV